VLACLLQKNEKLQTLLGDIHKYCNWAVRFEDKHDCQDLPVIKVWTAR
jgi:hypothetical protein